MRNLDSAIRIPNSAMEWGDVAQLGEHLLCKQGVSGSIPLISTTDGWSRLGAGERGSPRGDPGAARLLFDN